MISLSGVGHWLGTVSGLVLALSGIFHLKPKSAVVIGAEVGKVASDALSEEEKK